MGSTAKPKHIQIYRSLIHLYPQAFQKQYSATMQQTFADLLEAEETAFGRLRSLGKSTYRFAGERCKRTRN